MGADSPKKSWPNALDFTEITWAGWSEGSATSRLKTSSSWRRHSQCRPKTFSQICHDEDAIGISAEYQFMSTSG